MADDPTVRNGTRYDALRMLAVLPFDRVGAQLTPYLSKDVDPELHMGAIGGLSDLQDDRAADALVRRYILIDATERSRMPHRSDTRTTAPASPQRRRMAGAMAAMLLGTSSLGAIAADEPYVVLVDGENSQALLNTMAFDGKTTAPEASMAVLKAEGDQRAAAIKAHQDDAPAAAKGSAAPADKGAKTKDQQVAEAQAHAKANGVDLVTALKALGYAS